MGRTSKNKDKIILNAYLVYCDLLKKEWYKSNDFSYSTIRPLILYLCKTDLNNVRKIFNTMLRYNYLYVSQTTGEKERASKYRVKTNDLNKKNEKIIIYFD